MMDLLAHELARLSGRRLPFPRVLACPFDCLPLRHVVLLEIVHQTVPGGVPALDAINAAKAQSRENAIGLRMSG
jgi:hypothetical protein